MRKGSRWKLKKGKANHQHPINKSYFCKTSKTIYEEILRKKQNIIILICQTKQGLSCNAVKILDSSFKKSV